MLAFPLGAAFLLAKAYPEYRCHLPADGVEYCHIALFVISSLLAYIITYTALEADSPTLVMVRKILAAGPEGLDKRSFHKFMTADLLVVPRCKDLLRDKMAYLDGDRYKLTTKGELLANLFIHYRRLIGAGIGG